MINRPRVAVTRRLPAVCEARLAQHYDVHQGDDETVYSPDVMAQLTARAMGVIVSPAERIDAAVIAALPQSVKIISTFSVGTDHIDIAAAKTKGLIVTNTPGVLTDATADIAMLLILSTMRRASEGERLLRAKAWTGWRPTQLMGSALAGKNLGIVGLGRIGFATALRAKAFGMNILYHNRTPKPEAGELKATYFAALDDMLRQSHVLSLHCPMTPDSKGLINARALALLPAGAVVVNTARGGHVVDADLIAALRSGQIAAAGLDVYDNEPHLHPDYLSLNNAVLLPHLGSGTTETRIAMGMRAIDNLDAVRHGQPPPYPV